MKLLLPEISLLIMTAVAPILWIAVMKINSSGELLKTIPILSI